MPFYLSAINNIIHALAQVSLIDEIFHPVCARSSNKHNAAGPTRGSILCCSWPAHSDGFHCSRLLWIPPSPSPSIMCALLSRNEMIHRHIVTYGFLRSWFKMLISSCPHVVRSVCADDLLVCFAQIPLVVVRSAPRACAHLSVGHAVTARCHAKISV